MHNVRADQLSCTQRWIKDHQEDDADGAGADRRQRHKGTKDPSQRNRSNSPKAGVAQVEGGEHVMMGKPWIECIRSSAGKESIAKHCTNGLAERLRLRVC